MKKLFSAITVILIFVAGYSQGYSYEIINTESVRKKFGPITSDNSGNTIITGQMETTLTLGAITLTNTNPSPGSYNTGFVAKKFSAAGFAWARMLTPLSVAGNPSWVNIYGVNTDASGNIYLTGNFNGKVDVGNNITLTSTKLGSNYTADIFIIKMSSNGTVAWGKSYGSADDGCNAGDMSRSVAVDNAGNVFVTGQVINQVFKNNTTCQDLCSNATTKSITCPIVLKYSATGTKVWEKRFVSKSAVPQTSCYYSHPGGTDIRTDGNNVFVLGYFYGLVDFGNGNLSTGSESVSNLFVSKLSGSGTTLWAKSFSGSVTNGYVVGDGLFVQGNDVYVRGILPSGTVSFGGCSYTCTSSKGFLAKLFSDGNCSWIQPIYGISYGTVPHPDGNLAMFLRRSGSPYPVGGWYGMKELSPLDGTAVDSTEFPLADTASAAVWGYPSIAQLPNGFVFSQQIQGTIHFDDLTITSAGTADNMVLITYSAASPVAHKTITPSELSSGIILYPNPTSDQVIVRNTNNKSLRIVKLYDGSGRIVYQKFIDNSQTTIDVKNFSAGFYYIRSDQLQATIKFVKQ